MRHHTLPILLAAPLLICAQAAAAPPHLLERLSAADAALADPEMPQVFPIEDPSANLDPFLDALEDLALGRAGRLKVRVAVYGDSNHAMDWASGRLRAALGQTFGHGGHGFVGAAKPWEWYHHTEVDLAVSRLGYQSFAVAEPRFREADHYGHAGLMGQGRRGSWVEFKSTDIGVPEDRAFSTFEIHFLCRPVDGVFDVLIDGQPLDRVDARCPEVALASRRYRVPAGPHALRLAVVGGVVRFFGAAFENDQPGVVVDGLGVSALSVFRLSQMDEAVFIDSLRRRVYDLVIFHTGSNMWAPQGHLGWMRTVIGRTRRALGPDVPILILSPPDFATRKLHGFLEGHPRMEQCTQEKRQAAQELKLAFWDFYAAMGGRGSVLDWSKKGVVRPDFIHFKPRFHDLMWGNLARAMMKALSERQPSPTANPSPASSIKTTDE